MLPTRPTFTPYYGAWRSAFDAWHRDVVRLLWELVLEYFDEPQIEQMLDEGCPNHDKT